MNFLDIRTLMFSQLITDILCTAVLISLWLQNQKRYAGLPLWVMDFAFQTTSALLIILRGSIPDAVSSGFNNPLVMGGALIGYLGLARFVGKRVSQLPENLPQDFHLLPGFDEYLIGYADRSAVLPREHAEKIVPGGNGVFQPVIVSAGQVVGTWKRAIKKGTVEITLLPFTRLSVPQETVLAAAERYSRFLELKVSLA